MVAADFFTANATIYDARDRPFLSDEAALRLATVAPLPPNARVLDVGAGTGRVAIPLARVGCDVVGIDRADTMLAVLADKTAAVPLKRAVADAVHLPFAEERFDAVVIARLLYLVPRWHDVLREAVRVIKYGGRILHEWANGEPDEPFVRIREKARELFERAGVPNPFHPGARVEAAIDRVLIESGFRRVAVLDLGPGPSLTMADFLDRLSAGQYSYTWNMPKDILPGCLDQLKAWAEASLDLTTPVPIPRAQIWSIYA